MANDRMWLVHKPTGKMALIAKHFGDIWVEYTGPRHEPYYSIQGLFAETDNSTDFEIQYESRDHAG
jgi:hypothetical protein